MNDICYAHPSAVFCLPWSQHMKILVVQQDHTAPVFFGLEGDLKNAYQLSRHFEFNVCVNMSSFHQSCEHIFLY
jgi:hypothetical protein